MTIEKELTTEDVENYLEENKDKRIFVRIPVSGNEDFSFDTILGLIKTLEHTVSPHDIDVIIYSDNSMMHSMVLADEKITSKSVSTDKLLGRLHLDYLPYTIVIISVPQNETNKEIMKSTCIKYGILSP